MVRFWPPSTPIERPLCGRFAVALGLSILWLTAAAQEPDAPAAPLEDTETAVPAEQSPASQGTEAQIPLETHLTRLETQIVFLDLVEERRFEEALPYAEAMTELTEQEFGSPSTEVATAFANLAYIQRSLRNFDESNEAFLAAIEMYRETEGPFAASTINPLVSMGANYHATGEYFQALNIFQEARTVNRRVFGLLNPDQVEIVYHIASTLSNMRRYEEAHQQQQDALRLMERLHGSESLEILPYIYRYAEWLASGFQFEAARNQYLRAMGLIRELDDPESGRLVEPLREMGNTFRLQKVAEGRGIGALRRALEVAEAQSKPDVLELDRVLRDIGDWYTAFSRVGPSGEEYLRAWELLGSVENGEELREEWFDDGDGDYVLREYPSSRGVVDADEPGAVEGHVRIVFDIDVAGRPRNVNVLESDPPGFKDATMQRAIGRSRFRPRIVEGELAYAPGRVRNFTFHYIPDDE
jgi:tetratricopeptide (TPR) repeat protein